jgi:hypothetical protein
MVQKRIDTLQATITKLVEELRIIEVKLDHYASSDRLAFGVHYLKYKTLGEKCLELMTDLQVLETELPPDHCSIMNDQTVS